MRPNSSADCILVGGGLSNSLIALALKAARPDLRTLIVERGDRIGGNHTWSFHSSDFDEAANTFLKPLVVGSWKEQAVMFPNYARTLATPYNSIASERLHEAVLAAIGPGVMLKEQVASVSAEEVTLADGHILNAACVIDGRGAEGSENWQAGYQKFVGLEVDTVAPHGLASPILMDATVEQFDGYRFVYTLPFSANRLLIEDTYYSNRPELDEPQLEARIQAYAAAKGWTIGKVVRRERGVLPIPYRGAFEDLWRLAGDEAPRAGLRALLFHPTTGYSLPDAVGLALAVAALDEVTSRNVARLAHRLAREAWANRSFFRMLNRLMFVAAKPDERRNVMQRFYTLPEPLIRRFYACDLTLADKTRILTGKPPISFFRALRCVPE
jgi:lycopene beta-cyclase